MLSHNVFQLHLISSFMVESLIIDIKTYDISKNETIHRLNRIHDTQNCITDHVQMSLFDQDDAAA